MVIYSYTDAAGIAHESYAAACVYYGIDTPEQLAAEDRWEREAWDIERQDMMEGRGGPRVPAPEDEMDIPF